MDPSLALLVDGEWIDASRREAIDVVNPADGTVLGRLPVATAEDVDRAADAAQRAFAGWRGRLPLERARILHDVAATLRARSRELGAILTREQGKPLREAIAEVVATADSFEWMAEEGRRVYGRIVPSRYADAEQYVVQEPIGPVAAFAPWNFPAVLAGRKIAMALAAGCPVVIKPAEEAPGIVLAIARTCVEAGVPAGALNVLFGVPAMISERLIARPEIRKVSFTGSIPVGRHLATLAAAKLKRATLELGGHAPVIVCDDADPERAVTLANAAKFRNAGQICNCPTRFLVQRKLYPGFVDRFASLASALRVGNGLDEATQMGPLNNARRVAAMQELTRDAKDRGGRVVCGGGAPEELDEALRAGRFWAPTVIAGPAPGTRALTEEPFGPMALVEPFDDVEEAVARANAVEHGLAAYAFTTSLSRAKWIQDHIEAGCFSLNTFAVSPPELPYGGIKASGLGREMGIEGLLEHFHTKAVIRAT